MTEPEWLTARRTWQEVSRYPATSEEGHEAIIYEMRLPARFYRIICEDLDFDWGTGSGSTMRQLAEGIARTISEGMLSPMPVGESEP